MRSIPLFGLLFLCCRAGSAEPDFAKELPRIPPTEAKDARRTFALKPGYRIQQVAAEPLLASPVAMAWDENSRLFVVEMRGYSENRNENLSRINMLESTKGDGIYDKSTIFAENLLWPTAVACWDGGIFVGDAPHIYYLKDTNGDGKADVQKIAYTGFGTHNVQGLLNSFHWTLDNRIHGTASSCGGILSRPDDKAVSPVNINGRDFDFDPRTMALRPTSGGAQHGMSFDDYGHKFVSSNSDHVQQVMYEDRYLARNPFAMAPPPRTSIASDGPQAEVYRTSPVEPWRIVRTRLRVQGGSVGIVEGGGRASGYFTGATGVTIYRGDATPDLKGLAIVADVGSNLVHRKKLTLAEGIQYRADRIDKDSEFLTSTDNWFRPVQFANGPDGCLHIIDMYRETIEHPASLPPEIKKHLDLTSGRDRGRLYRILQDGQTPRAMPKLGNMTSEELVKLLDHPNAWHRETASRLIYQRQDVVAANALFAFLKEAKTDLGRIHAMYALSGLAQLYSGQVQAALANVSPRVQEHALRLLPTVPASPASLNALIALADSKDAFVRLQLAFTIGELTSPSVAKVATEKYLQSGTMDRWERFAAMTALGDAAGAICAEMLLDAKVRSHPNSKAFLVDCVKMLSRQNRVEDAILLSTAIQKLPETEGAFTLTLLQAANEGGDNLKKAFAKVVPPERLTRLLKSATATIVDETQPVEDRIAAVRTLALGHLADVRGTLVKLLDLKQPGEVQLAALAVLDRFGDPALAEILLKNWPTLSPRLRAAAGEAILSRKERITVLLDAIEKQTFSPVNLDGTQIKRLMAHKDPTTQKRAAVLLAAFKPARRTEVVTKYRKALEIKGDAAKGKILFVKNCAACHKLEGIGQELGANLAAMKNRGVEAILTNVLDPNAEVNPQYVNYSCNLDDGRTITGMIQFETATSVTFVRGEGLKDTVSRSNIESLKSTGLSLMPEGLEKDISIEAMADLIAYLMQVP